MADRPLEARGEQKREQGYESETEHVHFMVKEPDMADKMFRTFGNLIVWGPFSAVDADGLDRVEREIGRPLPGGYREFMLVANGGRLGYSISLPPGEAGTPVSFDELIPVERLAHAWQRHRAEAEMTGLPSALLPIADEAGGSRLYLDLRPETQGHVFAFVHGLPEWAGGDGMDSAGVVAAEWSGYLEQLTVDEDLAEITWRESVSEDDDSPESRAWREAVVAWLDAGLPGWRRREWAD